MFLSYPKIKVNNITKVTRNDKEVFRKAQVMLLSGLYRGDTRYVTGSDTINLKVGETYTVTDLSILKTYWDLPFEFR